MPNDLYQWEAAGGLVHHCPQCFKPLTTRQAPSRCLGNHVEWCKNYHTQLFKKGNSGECDPCIRGEEQHEKRHREIAEILHELKRIKAKQVPPLSPMSPKALSASPLSPKSMPGISGFQGIENSPMTKKERKVAKKAKKVSEMPKVITVADIQFVAMVLHPNDTDDEIDIERQLIEDPDIKLHRFFHKGTSNRRDIRNEFVHKERKCGKVELHVEAGELDGLLQLLNVSPITASTTTQEKGILTDLRTRIEADLIQMHREYEGKMMRKGGFWRWASKKAYNRLIENGRIWGQKDSEVFGSSTNTSDTGPSNSNDSDETEADTDITTPAEVADAVASLEVEGKSITTSTVVVSTSLSTTPSKCGSIEDGWTTIGDPGKVKKKKAIANLKLVHNGGLGKLVQSPDLKRRGFGNLNAAGFGL